MPAGSSVSTACFLTMVALLATSACTTPDKVALEQYAPQSPDADIEAVSLSATDDDTFDPTRVGTDFPDTTKQVAVWYKWKEADSGKKVGIRWSKDGQVVLEQGDTLAKISGASSYILKMAAGSKLPVGSYQVELLENGVAVTKIPFKVGAGGTNGAEPSGTATTNDNTETAAEATTTASADTNGAPEGEETSEQASEARPAAEPVEALAESPAAEANPSAASVSKAAGTMASQETKWPGVVAEITEFARKGKTLTAKLRFTNKGREEARPSFYYSETYVLDPNNKKIEVLKDDAGHYLAALTAGYGNWWSESLKPGASQTVWMRFPAPPTGMNVLTLQIPGMDPFEEVEVQD